MNWEAIAAIGETAGAAAVVISIVYLSVQIKPNTRATMASASFDASHSWAEFNEHMMLAPEDVLGLTLRTYDPNATAEDLSETEFMRMAVAHRTIFQKLEGQYYLYKYGSLEAGVWENRKRVARGILELPLYREWWTTELRSSIYSDEFVQALEVTSPAELSSLHRKPTPAD